MPPAKRSPSSRSTGSRRSSASSSSGAPGRSASSSSSGTSGRSSPASPARSSSGSGAGASPDGILSAAEQLVRGVIKPQNLVMLTRDRIQETLDEAAARGRVTRKDANELAAELVRRGRSQTDELLAEIEALLERGREGLEAATRRAVGDDPVDRIVRGADRARRTVGVTPTFPIVGYDELNASQVRRRLVELSRPELRKVLNYERRHANRKTVVSAAEKLLS